MKLAVGYLLVLGLVLLYVLVGQKGGWLHYHKRLLFSCMWFVNVFSCKNEMVVIFYYELFMCVIFSYVHVVKVHFVMRLTDQKHHFWFIDFC